MNSAFERINDGMVVFFYWVISFFLRFVPVIKSAPRLSENPLPFFISDSETSDSDRLDHEEYKDKNVVFLRNSDSDCSDLEEYKDINVMFSETSYSDRLHLEELVRNQTDLALSIAKRLFSEEEYKDKNVVFSPLSIHAVLSIIAAGSGGATLDELLTFLRCKSTDDLNFLASKLCGFTDGPRVCFANGVWVEQSFPIHPSFKELLTTNYKAMLACVDFQSKADEVADEVNLWVEEKTNGLIKDVLPHDSVDSLTRLVFANALYFKAAWEDKFDPSETKDHDFHLLNGTSVKVPFMTSMRDQSISVFDGFKVLCLYYKCPFDMYIFLPNANDGLSALVEQMASESGFLERHLPRETVEVSDFRIPKFKFSFGDNISDVLKEMGLVLPFSRGNANLSKMVDPLICQEKLYVSNIRHKAFIAVDEKGTEAAAATVAEYMGFSIYEKKVIDFVADHPFIFLIRERFSGTVLFIGQVLNPLDE